MYLRSREALIDTIRNFNSAYPEEIRFKEQFLNLLDSPRCFYRNHLPGHITASAWILNHDKSKVLLLKHAKLNKWLQPGGHADGDENVLQVALKEAEEETGLRDMLLLSEGIYDLDIHTIPARHDFAEHLHYDIRFCFEAGEEAPLTINEESTGLKWVPVNEIARITENDSMIRMAKKTGLINVS